MMLNLGLNVIITCCGIAELSWVLVYAPPERMDSPILDKVGPVGDDDGGEDGLGPGVVVGVVRPDGGDGQPEHVVQLLAVSAAHWGHLTGNSQTTSQSACTGFYR